MKRGIFEASIESELLFARFSKMQEGEVCSYNEMVELLGKDPRDNCRSALHTAIRRVLQEKRFVLSCIRGVGYRRLPPSDILLEGQHDLKRVRRMSKRSAHKQHAIDFDRLDNEERIVHNSRLSLFRIIAKIGEESAVKKLSVIASSKEDTLIPLAKAAERLLEATQKK